MSAIASEIAARFSENLVQHRRRKGLAQDELGRRAELHRTEISLLEQGVRVPRLDTLLKIAGALDIKPCELLNGMSWTPGTFTPGGFDLTRQPDCASGEGGEQVDCDQ